AMLFELRFDQRQRETGSDQGDVALQTQQVRHSTDVILVAVREHDADDVVETILDRLEVGEDQVDARLMVLGEEHAAVDDEDLAVVFERGHVATDLIEPAEWNDPKGSCGEWFWGGDG